jgi:WD40 repeat protein
MLPDRSAYVDELADRRFRRRIPRKPLRDESCTTSGVELVSTRRQATRVTAIAALDERSLAVASGDVGALTQWGATSSTTEPVLLGKHGSRVTGMAAADGWLVTTGTDHRVLLWSCADKNPVPRLLGAHRSGAVGPAVLADSRVVTSSHDGQILVWNTTSPGSALELGQHPRGTNALAASSFGRIASAGHDGQVLVWDLLRDSDIPVRILGLRSWTLAMTFLHDGRLVTTNGPRGEIRAWTIRRGHAESNLLGHHGDWVFSVVELTNGRVLTAGGGRLNVWNLAYSVSVVPVALGAGTCIAACALGAATVATTHWTYSGTCLVQCWGIHDSIEKRGTEPVDATGSPGLTLHAHDG